MGLIFLIQNKKIGDIRKRNNKIRFGFKNRRHSKRKHRIKVLVKKWVTLCKEHSIRFFFQNQKIGDIPKRKYRIRVLI